MPPLSYALSLTPSSPLPPPPTSSSTTSPKTTLYSSITLHLPLTSSLPPTHLLIPYPSTLLSSYTPDLANLILFSNTPPPLTTNLITDNKRYYLLITSNNLSKIKPIEYLHQVIHETNQRPQKYITMGVQVHVLDKGCEDRMRITSCPICLFLIGDFGMEAGELSELSFALDDRRGCVLGVRRRFLVEGGCKTTPDIVDERMPNKRTTRDSRRRASRWIQSASSSNVLEEEAELLGGQDPSRTSSIPFLKLGEVEGRLDSSFIHDAERCAEGR